MLILDERETRQTNKPDNEITDREVAAGKSSISRKLVEPLRRIVFARIGRTAGEEELSIGIANVLR